MTNMTRPRLRTRSFLTAAAALSLALPLAACGDSDEETDAPPAITGGGQEQTTLPDDGAATDDTTDDATAGGGGNGYSAAGDEAMSDAAATAVSVAEDEAGGTAFEVDLEDDREWEISVAVGNEEIDVRVSADGTEVLDTRPDGNLDDDERTALEAATVGIAEAIATALAEVDGTFDDADLDDDRGAIAWAVTIDGIDDDVEVYVDVASGEILEIEND